MNKLGNWLMGGGIVIVWGLTMGFIEWRASVHANNAVIQAGGVSPAQFEGLEDRVGDLEIIHDKDVTRVEDKAERIATILMGD